MTAAVTVIIIAAVINSPYETLGESHWWEKTFSSFWAGEF